MADWVKCSSAHYEDKFVWVNLDQVVCIEPEVAGNKITYAGGESFYVSEPAEALLDHLRVRDA